MNEILYYNGAGQPVYSPGMTEATRTAGGNILVPPIGNYCADNNSYIVAPSITFTADNTAGITPVIFKFTSFDNVVEAVNGSISGAATSWFTVDEFGFGAGTIAQEDGTNIFSADAVRRFTATYALAITSIVVTGTGVANVTKLPITVFKGNLTTVDRSIITATLDTTNSTTTPVLRFDGLWYLSSNKAFIITVPTGLITSMTFGIAGYKPYTELF